MYRKPVKILAVETYTYSREEFFRRTRQKDPTKASPERSPSLIVEEPQENDNLEAQAHQDDELVIVRNDDTKAEYLESSTGDQLTAESMQTNKSMKQSPTRRLQFENPGQANDPIANKDEIIQIEDELEGLKFNEHGMPDGGNIDDDLDNPFLPANKRNRARKENAELPPIEVDSEKCDSQYRLQIGELEVFFPLQPYQEQLSYMSSLVSTLSIGTNSLLESPTGTGKTLCLLAVCLAWLKQKREQQDQLRAEKEAQEEEARLRAQEELLEELDAIPEGVDLETHKNNTQSKRGRGRPSKESKDMEQKMYKERLEKAAQEERKKALEEANTKFTIIYASRTHSQLNQVVEELKKLVYKPRMAFVGSREQLCIHEKVRGTGENWKRDLLCKIECQTGQCPYKTKVEGFDPNRYKQIREAEREAQKKGADAETLQNIRSQANNLQVDQKIEGFAESILTERSTFNIEEYREMGRNTGACPYYTSKNLLNKADIIFMPYNYLTNVSISQKYESLVKNSILIFDEAHNIERNAEEGTSFELELEDVTALLSKLKNQNFSRIVTSPLASNDPGSGGESAGSSGGHQRVGEKHMTFLRNMCDYLAKLFHTKREELQKVYRDNNNNCCVLTIPDLIRFIFTLPKVNQLKMPLAAPHTQPEIKDGFNRKLNEENLKSFVFYLECIFKSHKAGEMGLETSLLNESFERVLQFFNFLAILYHNYQQYQSSNKWYQLYSNHFRALISVKGDGKASAGIDSIFKIKIWALSPFYTINKLKKFGPRSLVLTSGTLSPMEGYESVLRTRFPIKVSCGHVIDPRLQLLVAVPKFMTHRKDKLLIKMDYENRNNPLMVALIGAYIVNLAKVVPSGLLVFFVSYQVLKSYLNAWKTTELPGTDKSIMDVLASIKTVCIEEQDSQYQARSVSKFMDNYHKGAVFLAVCEGKLSEGVNFQDDMARCVVIIGTPFANAQDFKQKEKRMYLDYIKKNVEAEEQLIDGSEWYTQNAIRSLNQCIGRIIRHRNDYGAVILLDNRLVDPRMFTKFSRWISSNVRIYDNQIDVLRALERFYANINRILENVTEIAQIAHDTEELEKLGLLDTEPTSTNTNARILGPAPNSKSKFVAPVIDSNPRANTSNQSQIMPAFDQEKDNELRPVLAQNLRQLQHPVASDLSLYLNLGVPTLALQRITNVLNSQSTPTANNKLLEAEPQKLSNTLEEKEQPEPGENFDQKESEGQSTVVEAIQSPVSHSSTFLGVPQTQRGKLTLPPGQSPLSQGATHRMQQSPASLFSPVINEMPHGHTSYPQASPQLENDLDALEQDHEQDKASLDAGSDDSEEDILRQKRQQRKADEARIKVKMSNPQPEPEENEPPKEYPDEEDHNLDQPVPKSRRGPGGGSSSMLTTAVPNVPSTGSRQYVVPLKDAALSAAYTKQPKPPKSPLQGFDDYAEPPGYGGHQYPQYNYPQQGYYQPNYNQRGGYHQNNHYNPGGGQASYSFDMEAAGATGTDTFEDNPIDMYGGAPEDTAPQYQPEGRGGFRGRGQKKWEFHNGKYRRIQPAGEEVNPEPAEPYDPMSGRPIPSSVFKKKREPLSKRFRGYNRDEGGFYPRNGNNSYRGGHNGGGGGGGGYYNRRGNYGNQGGGGEGNYYNNNRPRYYGGGYNGQAGLPE